MAISATCCLNLTPPRPSSPTTVSNKAAWSGNEKWRAKCAVTMACVVLGLEVGNLVTTEESLGVAHDMQFVSSTLTVESKDSRRALRWSDKRVCPPWHLNSLETIVPENLPRPSARRRWEAVAHHAQTRPSQVAPDVVVYRSRNSCFSL